jgi:hypothetical protein
VNTDAMLGRNGVSALGLQQELPSESARVGRARQLSAASRAAVRQDLADLRPRRQKSAGDFLHSSRHGGC